MFYEANKLVLQFVIMTGGSANHFVEMLLPFQYFNIFLIKCFVFLFF